MSRVHLARAAALAGYAGIVCSLLAGRLLAPPAQSISWVALIMLLLPLLAPLRGLWLGRAYTHAWASFLALFYFIVGVWYAAAPAGRGHGFALIAASLLFYTGALAYARLTGRRRG